MTRTPTCRPIAALYSAQKLLAISEWHDTAKDGDGNTGTGATDGAFCALLGFDAAALPLGPRATLRLQVRHVIDPFWDVTERFAERALLLMPLIGEASMSLKELLDAATGGNMGGCVTESLLRPADVSGTQMNTASQSAVIGGTIRARITHAQGFCHSRTTPLHSVSNYLWLADSSVPLSTHLRADWPSKVQPNHLRASEHFLPCAYGLIVPRYTLAMLLEDAELNAAMGDDASVGDERPLEGESDEQLLLSAIDSVEWMSLSNWIRKIRAQLEDFADTATGMSSGVRQGFKPSSHLNVQDLEPMPLGLGVAVFEVLSQRRSNAVYPTVVLGAPAARSMGFHSGGADAISATLMSDIDKRRHEKWRKFNVLFAKRVILLKCQIYAALAASFAVSCQEAAARSDRAFFAQLLEVGYLVHVESLLTSRGDEWGMFQDLNAAVGMLRHLRLKVAAAIPAIDRTARGAGVSVRGSRLQPVLAFAPTELGFRDMEHAAHLGFPAGSAVTVTSVVSTQGINDEQSLANFFQTNLREQSRINLFCVDELQEYHSRLLRMARAASSHKSPGMSEAADGKLAGASVLRTPPKSPGRGFASGGAATHSRDVRVRTLLTDARSIAQDPPQSKNTDLLHTISSIVRLLGGGRMTLCATGLDRTLMSVTFEHGRLLQDHGLEPPRAPAAVAAMRRSGVARDCATRHGSKERVFDFNAMQTSMLPDCYRPPEGSARSAR